VPVFRKDHDPLNELSIGREVELRLVGTLAQSVFRLKSEEFRSAAQRRTFARHGTCMIWKTCLRELDPVAEEAAKVVRQDNA
jgi:hypothetical protein